MNMALCRKHSGVQERGECGHCVGEYRVQYEEDTFASNSSDSVFFLHARALRHAAEPLGPHVAFGSGVLGHGMHASTGTRPHVEVETTLPRGECEARVHDEDKYNNNDKRYPRKDKMGETSFQHYKS